MKRIPPIVHVVAVFVVTVMLSGFAAKPQELQTKPVDDPEAYSAYTSLLPAEWSVRVAHAKTLVFQQETGTNWKCMPSGKPLETDWKLVVDSFHEENAGTRLSSASCALTCTPGVIAAFEVVFEGWTVKASLVAIAPPVPVTEVSLQADT